MGRVRGRVLILLCTEPVRLKNSYLYNVLQCKQFILDNMYKIRIYKKYVLSVSAEGHRFDSCWENSEIFFACVTD